MYSNIEVNIQFVTHFFNEEWFFTSSLVTTLVSGAQLVLTGLTSLGGGGKGGTTVTEAYLVVFLLSSGAWAPSTRSNTLPL